METLVEILRVAYLAEARECLMDAYMALIRCDQGRVEVGETLDNVTAVYDEAAARVGLGDERLSLAMRYALRDARGY